VRSREFEVGTTVLLLVPGDGALGKAEEAELKI
jgi:hypothetical protein